MPLPDDVRPIYEVDPELADMLVRASNMTWIMRERREYADRKYPPGSPNYDARLADMRANGIGPGSTEVVFLTNYLKRAELLGLDTLLGRQAFAKFVVTAFAILDRVVMAYGPLPEPGHPSGVIVTPTSS